MTCKEINKNTFFEKDSSILSLLDRLNESKNLDSKGKLDCLSALFEALKEKTPVNESFKDRELQTEGLTHVKENLIKKSTALGELRYDVIYFKKQQATCYHTHPEFVIDEVFLGRLLETPIKKQDDGLYKQQNDILRRAGSTNRSFSPDGSPHRVMGLDELNVNFLLTVGNLKAEVITEVKGF